MKKLILKLKGFNHKSYLLILFLLFISSFVLLSFDNASGALETCGNCQEKTFVDTEAIYEKVGCNECKCFDEGKKLFAFQGTDADCEKKNNEYERSECYKKYSFATFICQDIYNQEKQQECYAKYGGQTSDFYLGGAGTMIHRKEMIVNGQRTYFTGFNNQDQHRILTGFNDAANTVMIFRKNSRDLEIGDDIFIGEKIKLLSSSAVLYFGADPIFGKINYGNLEGLGIVDAYRGNALRLPVYRGAIKNHLAITSNYHDFITLPTGIGKVEIEKGMEIEQDLRTGTMKFLGKELLWSEPIRGNFILYYK